jgi:hypothetical protein
MGFVDDAKENIAEGFEKAKDVAEEAGEFVKDKVTDVSDHVHEKLHEDDAPATPPAAG